ncbi:MAG: hypothetical protein ACOY91_23805 [Pseudomonadota bacterium]
MPKTEKKRPDNRLPLPLFVPIVSDKGGIGKSLLAKVMAEWARLHKVPCGVVEVDTTGQSLKGLTDDVVSIAIDERTARRHPATVWRALTPLYQTIERIGHEGGMTIVEFGANEAARGALWAGMTDLQEELELLGTATLIVTPYTCQAEAMRRGVRSANAFMEVLPQARLMLVENERDGRICDLHRSSEAAAVSRSLVGPLAAKAVTVKMPAIEEDSWAPFEAANVRLLDAVMMPVREIMAFTGLPLPEAKIIKGNVASWCGDMFKTFDRLIDTGTNEDD